MNFVMDRSSFRDLRKKALKDRDGVVLEIGFWTGLNLPFYPPAVQKVLGADPENFQKASAHAPDRPALEAFQKLFPPDMIEKIETLAKKKSA